jgi:hypothetical protein
MKTKIDRTMTAGGILVLVMVVLLAFSLLVLGLLQLGRYNAIETSIQQRYTEAFWLAESGLEHIKAIMAYNRTPLEKLHLLGINVLSGTTTNGNYSVDAEDDPDWDNLNRIIKKYIITSTGTARDGTVQTVELKAVINTFGDYLWATHSESSSSLGNIYFATGDRIYGQVYTDDQLNIYGTPVFYDLVQSVANSVNYDGGGNSSVFRGGLKLGVQPLDWGDVQAQVSDLKNDPAAQTFTGNYDITFSNTTAIFRNRTSGSVTTNIITAGKIFYVTGNAYVKGTVGTRVTLATTQFIYITDDIVYKSAAPPNKPSANPTTWGSWEPPSTESLGLYSQTGVQIVSGVGAVYIHAAVLVPTGSFNAYDWNNYIGRPYINFYGSIGQYNRGIIGLVSGAGYLKNYHYDNRLHAQPPPGMPYSAYVFTEWRYVK